MFLSNGVISNEDDSFLRGYKSFHHRGHRILRPEQIIRSKNTVNKTKRVVERNASLLVYSLYVIKSTKGVPLLTTANILHTSLNFTAFSTTPCSFPSFLFLS